MDPRVRWLAGACAVLLALATGVLIGRLPDDGGTEPPRRRPSAGKPAQPPPGAAIPGGIPDETSATFTARARSVESDAPLPAVERMTLRGDVTLDATIVGTVQDARGRRYRSGRLLVEGDRVRLRGSGIQIDVGSWTLSRRAIAFEAGAFTTIRTGQRVVVAARRIVLTNGENQRVLESPVTLQDGISIDTEADPTDPPTLRWTNPPAVMTLEERERTTLSWAGNGRLHARKTGVLRARYGGVIGTDLLAEIRRRGSAIRLSGTATYTQLFVNGRPQVRTTGRIEFPVPGISSARIDGRSSFTWAPRNTGDYDLCITRIRAASRAGRWVNLRLEPLPAMFGGESRRRIGGDTRTLDPDFGFFGGAVPIASLIGPRDADRRDITFDVPEGTKAGRHTIVLVLEGNFPPVTARVRVRVS